MTAFPVNKTAPTPGQAISRAAFAHLAVAARLPKADDPESYASTRWPTDGAAQALVRAAASPGAAADHPALVATTVRDYLGALPQSAAARLLAEAMNVSLARDGSLTVPYDATPVDAGAPWVAELAPIPVNQGVTAAVTVGPARTLGVILTVSRNLIRQPGAEGLLRRMLQARAAWAFDAALFSSAAGSDTVVAGLLNGVTATAPLSLSTRDVLAELGNALAAAGGSGSVVIAAHPGAAAAIQIDHPDLTWPILPCPALPPGRVVAIDPAGLVFGTSGGIDIEATNAALIHMSDDPAEIASDAPATADPVREIWQTDAIALRLLVDLAFAARPGSVQFVDGAQ